MNQVNKKKKHNRVKILLIILTVLLVVLSVGYFYLQSKLNLINRTTPTAVILPEKEYFEADEDTTDDASKDTEVNPDDVVWPVDEDFMKDKDIIKKDKDIINILLIGQDRRPGEQRARSDSMMIATINKKNNTVSITSLMRDMYVQIPGYSDNRINAAYAFGGMELLDATIEKNLLVHIDGNIEVDFNGFQQAIDKIGGVDISINAKEADYLNKNGFTGLSEGTVYMDGKLALAYSRIRKVGNNDYERTERQRKVQQYFRR